MALVPVTVAVQDDAPLPLDGVLVQVFDDMGIYVTEATTGTTTPGVADLILNGDAIGISYTLRFSLSGYIFSNGAEDSVVVTDPPSPDNDFGPYEAVLGPSVPLVTIRTLEADLTTPIPSVVLRIYDQLDAFVAEGTTDSSGEFKIPLDGSVSPGTTYIVRPILAGTIFNPAQTIVVEDPLTPPNLNEFDIVGEPIILPTAVDPSYCRITGCLGDITGRGLKRRNIRITPVRCYPDPDLELSHHYTSEPTLVDGKILASGVEIQTDSNGNIDVELPRGGIFCIHLTGFENPITILEPFTVPDASACDLNDLLFPYSSSVVYSPASAVLNLTGGITKATFDVTVSDQIGREYDVSKITELLTFSSSDENIVTVKYDSGTSKLVATAVSVGAATISASRVEGSFAPRIPVLPALVSMPIPITVT